MPSATNEYGRYYLTFKIDTTMYLSELRRTRDSFKGISNRYPGITFRTKNVIDIFNRWIKDFSVVCETGFLYSELKHAGVREQKRAANKYQSTQEGPTTGRGIGAFIDTSDFYEIMGGRNKMTLVVGNLDVLDQMTLGWKEKYANKTAEDWYPGPPPYLNAPHGYWVWQEMGAGPPQHWLLTTMQRYPDYKKVGGNLEARHIFLRGAQELHGAQHDLFSSLMKMIEAYRPRGY